VLRDRYVPDPEELTVTRTRSLLLLILAIFAVYVIVRNPTESANIMRQGITAVGNTLQALGTFFSQLFSG
jgi:hypothetical protein